MKIAEEFREKDPNLKHIFLSSEDGSVINETQNFNKCVPARARVSARSDPAMFRCCPVLVLHWLACLATPAAASSCLTSLAASVFHPSLSA